MGPDEGVSACRAVCAGKYRCAASSKCLSPNCNACPGSAARNDLNFTCVPATGAGCSAASNQFYCAATVSCVTNCISCPNLKVGGFGGACFGASGSACSSNNKGAFCATTQSCLPAANCSACAGLTMYDPVNHQCIEASATGCRSVGGRFYCPLLGTCVVSCTTCITGSTAQTASEPQGQCVAPTAASCKAAGGLALCPFSPPRCVPDCTGCQGFGATWTSAAGAQCVVPTTSGCNTPSTGGDRYAYCPSDNLCKKIPGGCSTCAGLEETDLQGPSCVVPLGFGCEAASKQFSCTSDKICKPGNCASCLGFPVVDALSYTCVAATGDACFARQGQYYCRSLQRCVANCSFCDGLVAHDTVGHTCVAASGSGCFSAVGAQYYCPDNICRTAPAGCGTCGSRVYRDDLNHVCVSNCFLSDSQETCGTDQSCKPPGNCSSCLGRPAVVASNHTCANFAPLVPEPLVGGAAAAVPGESDSPWLLWFLLAMLLCACLLCCLLCLLCWFLRRRPAEQMVVPVYAAPEPKVLQESVMQTDDEPEPLAKTPEEAPPAGDHAYWLRYALQQRAVLLSFLQPSEKKSQKTIIHNTEINYEKTIQDNATEATTHHSGSAEVNSLGMPLFAPDGRPIQYRIHTLPPLDGVQEPSDAQPRSRNPSPKLSSVTAYHHLSDEGPLAIEDVPRASSPLPSSGLFLGPPVSIDGSSVYGGRSASPSLFGGIPPPAGDHLMVGTSPSLAPIQQLPPDPLSSGEVDLAALIPVSQSPGQAYYRSERDEA
eukprot:NODE_234_length_2415_cov_18.462384_g181_i0.p1 GENE.NODE_234_length_2415_cov_18.462384_g181_i0~~NODE_234_length_2415_cov_18.462384_g181_i0.p1  ORF type:complete len:770 (+),score=129.28 NODE_234_length_2415_cov_18.462384_g181_i0:23-2332(+)